MELNILIPCPTQCTLEPFSIHVMLGYNRVYNYACILCLYIYSTFVRAFVCICFLYKTSLFVNCIMSMYSGPKAAYYQINQSVTMQSNVFCKNYM